MNESLNAANTLAGKRPRAAVWLLLAVWFTGAAAHEASAQDRLIDPSGDRRARKEQHDERIERNREFRQQRELRREEIRERVREADQNHDRALSRAEAEQQFPRLGRRFNEIDANHDGFVSPEELRNFRDARRRARTWDGGGDDPRD